NRGLEISTILLLFCAFYSKNSMNLLYVIVVCGCYVFGATLHHDPHVYTERIWTPLVVIMMLWLLLQYWIVIPYELSSYNMTTRWKDCFHFGRNFTGHDAEYWAFLPTVHYTARDLYFDFFAYLMVSLQYCYFAWDILREHKLRKRAKTKGEDQDQDHDHDHDQELSPEQKQQPPPLPTPPTPPTPPPDDQDREQQTQQETATMKDNKDEEGKLGVHKALLQSVGKVWDWQEEPWRKRLGLTDSNKGLKIRTKMDRQADVLWEQWKAHTLLYCDKVLLIIMFAFGIRTVTILSTVFLMFPFWQLFFAKPSEHRKLIRWWGMVEIYTWGILSLSILYQLPWLPHDHEKKHGFVSWPSVVGMEKLNSNGNGYCPPKNDCKNPFSDTSIIFYIVLLLVIDFQIKILHSNEYHRFLKLYQYWKENSDIRRYHSAQLMKFRRYSLIRYYAHEEMMVKRQLNELFDSEEFKKSLTFRDSELTIYPPLVGDDAVKEQMELNLYGKSALEYNVDLLKKRAGIVEKVYRDVYQDDRGETHLTEQEKQAREEWRSQRDAATAKQQAQQDQ
ncbi:hypothetical protein RFI_28627, partial [Reticulomyxa filosa]